MTFGSEGENPAWPFPARVEMSPVVTETIRTLLLPVSATYTLPAWSKATSAGNESCAFTAGPSSPDEPHVEPAIV